MNIKNIVAAALIAIATISVPLSTLAFDFNGPYAGVGVVHSTNGTTAPTILAGYDHRFDFFILGTEVFSTIENTPVLGVDVKAGVVVTEDLAIYGLAGVQRDTGKTKNSNSFGIGADLALADGIALTGSYKQVYDLGTFNNRDDQFRIGLKFSF